MKIFLVRHASPDWDRKDIPYDILPGPRLSLKGEKEAKAVAMFLSSRGVVKLYYSPFERAARAAQIAATASRIHAMEERGLAEWRFVDEPEVRVRKRMLSVFEQTAKESAQLGPIALLLLELGMDKDELARYRTRFDTTNPLPPAGVWQVEKHPTVGRWRFDMVFWPERGGFDFRL